MENLFRLVILEETLSNILVISKVKNKILGFQFEDNILCRIHDFQSESLVGNVYCGYVKDVVRNIQAAFVEFDEDKKGFLSLSNLPFSIKQGDKILVQVTSDKVKTKDYLLTWKLNLSSEQVVLTVGDTGVNISKKIKDRNIREELKKSFRDISNDEYGFILRTNSVLYTIEELKRQAEQLVSRYREYQNKMTYAKPKTAVYLKNYVLEICREFVNKLNGTIITDVENIYQQLMQEQIQVIWNDDSKINLLNKYSLEKHIKNALSKHVWLKSGAYLIIEHTEAMTVIDVNTGKADMHTDRKKTITQINKEAAKEIARQLKIRNISGTIVVDFINMEKMFYDELISYMRQCISADFTLCSVIDITKLGLMEITRKKQAKPLLEIIADKVIK